MPTTTVSSPRFSAPPTGETVVFYGLIANFIPVPMLARTVLLVVLLVLALAALEVMI